jgi:hypothetical protein
MKLPQLGRVMKPQMREDRVQDGAVLTLIVTGLAPI